MMNGISVFLKASASKVTFRLMVFTRAICLREHVKTPIARDVYTSECSRTTASIKASQHLCS